MSTFPTFFIFFHSLMNDYKDKFKVILFNFYQLYIYYHITSSKT